MSTPTVRWNRYGGVAIAVLGFVVSRQFVAQTITPDQPLSVLLLSLPPLVVGLGLTVYGVILAVGRFSPTYVRTVTVWCGLGTAGAAGLVVLTQLSAMGPGSTVDPLADAQLLVANVLLGGAVAGVLLGDRSVANSRKRREIQRTANRAALVNRRLRHDVINAATIIDGHAGLLRETPGRTKSVEAITTAADRITTTIEEVGQIATPNENAALRTVDLGPVLSTAVDEVDSTTADTSIQLTGLDGEQTVMADDRLERLFGELLVNAVEYGSESVTVSVETTSEAVTVSIEDGGPGLPDDQRRLLEAGEFPEYDDPSAGFGLQAARLLVDRYGGQLQSRGSVDSDEPHRLTVRLPRYADSGSLVDRAGVRLPTIGRAVTAGLLAGVVMGGFYQAATGTMPVIGALYGVSSVAVGWITHLFHSVVFALVFATGCTAFDIEQYVSSLLQAAGVGLAWGGMLWFVAAGFVMPAWLVAVGKPAALPTLELVGLIGHSVWGVTLGGSYVLLGRSGWFDARFETLRTTVAG